MTQFENAPAGEADQIANVVNLTLSRLDTRYPGITPVRRGVHPKDHGAVSAKFTILNTLAPELRVGVFAQPARQFDAFIRFSNADVNVTKPDSVVGPNGVPVHGSRGMAVKLMGVTGTPLMPTKGPLTQDFLMINQPVFAFANVVDYEALSQVLLANADVPDGFFARLGDPDPNVRQRAAATLGIVQRIQSNTMTAVAPAVPAYQPPPATPLDNRYFSAAPFLFGNDRVAKFSAKPVPYPPPVGVPNVADPNYLRTGLRRRLGTPAPAAAPHSASPLFASVGAGASQSIAFEFQVQIRDAASLAGKIDTDIENACFEWDETLYPFVTVATIAIPTQQDVDAPQQEALCEDLIFSPWNGLVEHQPIGGINRMRRAVYLASSQLRHAQPTPTGIRCPHMI